MSSDYWVGDSDFLRYRMKMSDWDKIVAKHGGTVWANACRLLGDRTDAADCFQEALLAALEVSRRQKVRNWAGLLGKLTTRKALDILRSRFRQAHRQGGASDFSSVASANPAPDQLAADAELVERARCAIAQLPEAQGEVFCLHYLGELKYREIARLLGMKTSAVGVTLHRARARLRELLSPEVAERNVRDAEVSE